MNLEREADLASRWDIPLEQFRVFRRRHGWSHVRLSRNDIRYTEAQVEHIVQQMTVVGQPVKSGDAGQTSRSAARAS